MFLEILLLPACPVPTLRHTLIDFCARVLSAQSYVMLRVLIPYTVFLSSVQATQYWRLLNKSVLLGRIRITENCPTHDEFEVRTGNRHADTAERPNREPTTKPTKHEERTLHVVVSIELPYLYHRYRYTEWHLARKRTGKPRLRACCFL